MTIGATPSASYLNDPFAQTSSSSLVSHKRISTSFSYTPDRGTTTSSSSVSTSSSRSRSFDAAPMMGADAHPRPQHSLYNPSHDELRQKHQQRSSLRLSKLSIGPEESMSCPSPPAEVLLVPSDLDAPAAAAASPGIAFQSNLQLDKAVWIDGSVAGLQGFPIMVDPHSARSRLTMEFVERSGIPVNIHSVIKFNVKVLIAHDVHVRVGGRTTLQTALVFPDSLCAADVVLGQPWIHQLHVRKCDESPHHAHLDRRR
ncbi:hypothetical protein DFJ73DRAFT_956662 [Zopfochytrium polystomum]|nr:hypothetical protein DFJ73DRAFT_956662 [Zopfochytrium polystomum]